MRSTQSKLGFYTDDPGADHELQPAASRKWPVHSTNLCEQNDDVQKGRTPGSKQSWGGEDSPVSVIGHAARNINIAQASHPSSGSSSMEHPVFTCTPPAPPPRHHPHPAASHNYHLSYRDFLSNEQPNYSSSEYFASTYAGLLSEQVQQAFRRSHELQTHVVKKSASSAGTHKRMEWLNLLEDPPFNAAKVVRFSEQSRTFAAGISTDGTQENRASSEEKRLSNYRFTRDRQDDEDSVIDFFPSCTDRPGSVIHTRRGSNHRVKENIGLESRRGSLQKRRSSCRGAVQHGYDGENELGRVSTSYKWDDAERWLTSPTTTSASSRSLTHLQPFTNVHLQVPAVKAELYTQLVQVQAGQPLSADPTSTQDKHVPMNGGVSHGRIKEAATQERRSRDIATQSTPAEWSRCDTPEEERAIFSTAPEKPSAETTDDSTGADVMQKISPPRHNTPARRSVSCSKQRGSRGLLDAEPAHLSSGKLNMLELESCHLDKLKLARDLPLGSSPTWLLLADDDSSECCEKSPSNYEPQQMKVNILEARVSAWEDVERAKHMAKFKREEAKIEAWESLQRAEADAELRKLEVKLEKMRFEGTEKIMGRLGAAQSRAQELRGVAEAQKVEQLTRVAMRANQIRKSGHLPSSAFNVMCSLTTKIKPTSNLSFS